MLEKIFIKNYKDVKNPKVRTAYAVLCSVLGIVLNIILSTSKMIIGLLSGSISIIADAIDNITDCASSILTLIGFKLASLPPDPNHPFGHERIEYLTGLIISIVIIVVGVLVGETSIKTIIANEPLNIENFYILIGILVFSIIIKIIQCIYYNRISKKINSTTLKASAVDSKNDAIKTGFVLVAMVIFKIWNVNLDGWFGLLLAIYILINGILLVKDTSNPLIGAAPSKELTSKIINKFQDYDMVLGIHDLIIHNYGPDKTFVTVHVEVDSRDNILDIHDNMDNIERDFKNDLGIELTIHMDPIELADPLTNSLRQEVEKILNDIDPILKFHDFRIVRGSTHTNILFDVVVPPKYKLSDEETSELIKEKVKEKTEIIAQNTVFVIINVDKDYIL